MRLFGSLVAALAMTTCDVVEVAAPDTGALSVVVLAVPVDAHASHDAGVVDSSPVSDSGDDTWSECHPERDPPHVHTCM